MYTNFQDDRFIAVTQQHVLFVLRSGGSDLTLPVIHARRVAC